jgi:hypothetical protein
MKLLINKFKKDELLTSYNFARNSDVVFSEMVTHEQFDRFKDKENLEIVYSDKNLVFYIRKIFTLKENHVIFCNSYFIEMLFNNIKYSEFQNLKIITHQTDIPVSKNIYMKKPKSVSFWYGININYKDKGLISIPIGIANDYSPKNLMKDDYKNLQEPDEKEQKIYLNFEDNTNINERTKIRKILKNQIWIVEESKKSLKDYLNGINKHFFNLAPWGNGYDTHRFWETLYANSIPITRDHITYTAAKELPVLFVKDYKELNLESLIYFLSDFNQKDYNYEVLNIKYWLNKIQKIKIKDVNKIENYIIKDEIIFKEIRSFHKKTKIQSRKKLILFRIRQIRKLLSRIIN